MENIVVRMTSKTHHLLSNIHLPHLIALVVSSCVDAEYLMKMQLMTMMTLICILLTVTVLLSYGEILLTPMDLLIKNGLAA